MFHNPRFTMQVIGNLAADPVIRHTNSGDKVANFRVLMNERWSDAQGQRQEKVYGVDCSVYRGLANVVEQYAKKGMRVLVEGKPVAEGYLKDGEARASLKIPSVNTFHMLSSGGDGTGQATAAPVSQEVIEEDIPF